MDISLGLEKCVDEWAFRECDMRSVACKRSCSSVADFKNEAENGWLAWLCRKSFDLKGWTVDSRVGAARLGPPLA